MLKKKVAGSLADKIAGVLNTAPQSIDPEAEEFNEATTDLSKEDLDEDEDLNEQIISSFRKKNIDLLEDLDERYAGKKSSRKILKDDEPGNASSELSDEEDESEAEDEEECSMDSDDDQDNTDGSEEEESDYEDGNLSLGEHEENDNFKHFKESEESVQVKKGICVRNQINLWENLLEIRIQLQKCLSMANKMPQKDYYKEIKQLSGKEFSNKVTDTKTSICTAMDKMLQLQKLLRKQYPETKKLNKNKKNVDDDPMDEEIPSETDEENSESEQEVEEETEMPPKRLKLAGYETLLQKDHDIYQPYRNSVIDKWNSKTRIAAVKNNTNSHSVLHQIEHNLSDKMRLRKRSQLKRSEYKILGEVIPESDQNETAEKPRYTEEYNTEIYDDDDFYHQLLRELIEVKSADITDPIQLGRQWIQLQNLRNKMKRKIDTRATKGRKIRYAVHSKLVNFMAPIEHQSWTDDAKTELYNSVFGKNQGISVE